MVVVDGVDVSTTSERKLTRWRARSIGIVFQFFQLMPTLTVLENIMMPMDFAHVHRPKDRREKAMSLLERFDVADQANKTPDLLSGGQQQRVIWLVAASWHNTDSWGDSPPQLVLETWNRRCEQIWPKSFVR